MHVDDDGVGGGAQRARRDLALQRREGIIQRIHEDAAERVDDEHARAVAGVEHRGAAPRRALGIIDRTDQPRRPLDEDQRLLLVPGMIAERDGIGAGAGEILVDGLGDAEAAGGVFAVHDDEIELPVADQSRQAFQHDGAAAAPQYVADEQDPHALHALRSMISRSVSTRSRRASCTVVGTASISWAAKAMPMAVTGFMARSLASVMS